MTWSVGGLISCGSKSRLSSRLARRSTKTSLSCLKIGQDLKECKIYLLVEWSPKFPPQYSVEVKCMTHPRGHSIAAGFYLYKLTLVFSSTVKVLVMCVRYSSYLLIFTKCRYKKTAIFFCNSQQNSLFRK